MYHITFAYIFLLFLTTYYYPIYNSIIRSSVYYIQTPGLSICNKRFFCFLCKIICSNFYLDPSPRDVRVARINDTTIQVFWSPIYFPPVERYIIHYNDKSENKPENQWSLYSPTSLSATTAVISGLKSSAMYEVRVSAEFANTNLNGTARREGDLSEVYVADIYRRKFLKIKQMQYDLFFPRNEIYHSI